MTFLKVTHKQEQALCVCVCVCVWIARLCLTLCDPTDCSPPGFSMEFSRQEHEWAPLPSPNKDWDALDVESHLQLEVKSFVLGEKISRMFSWAAKAEFIITGASVTVRINVSNIKQSCEHGPELGQWVEVWGTDTQLWKVTEDVTGEWAQGSRKRGKQEPQKLNQVAEQHLIRENCQHTSEWILKAQVALLWTLLPLTPAFRTVAWKRYASIKRWNWWTVKRTVGWPCNRNFLLLSFFFSKLSDFDLGQIAKSLWI